MKGGVVYDEIPVQLWTVFGGPPLTIGGQEVPLERRTVAELTVPTGQIVVCDALCGGDLKSLKKRFPTGQFPVVLTMMTLPGESSQRVGFASVRFNIEPPVRWRPAERFGGDWYWKMHRDNVGIPCDSWHLGFMDTAAQERLHALQSQYFKGNALAVEHAANDGHWNVHAPPEGGPNIVTFHTGVGSGVFACYVGYDVRGNIACLTCDLVAGVPRFLQMMEESRKRRGE
jgi:hypothetical protein